MTDSLKTLVFEKISARAQMVHLRETWKTVANNNPCPESVQTLMGQLLAASAMLSASLKFEGSLIIQIQGDGPLALIIAECNSRLGVRGTIKIRDKANIPEQANFKELVNQQGKGMCIIVLDPLNRLPGQAPYQGVVPLTGNTLSSALEAYMHSSEQLETRLVLHADTQCAAGLMIQQMPTFGGNAPEQTFDPDGWNRLQALADTLQMNEHLTTPPDELATRLFWEEKTTVCTDRIPHFECSCSRNKVGTMLLNLGPVEIEDILKDTPTIDVQCDFCGTAYRFDQTQSRALFLLDQAHIGQPPH